MTHTLAAVAAALFGVRLALFALLHLCPGGIDPVRDTVSDYAVSPSPRTRALSGCASRAAAAAWAALACALLTGDELGSGRIGVGATLLGLGTLLAVMPFVPTDRSGSPATGRGRVHLILAIAWFTLAYATIAPMARLLEPGFARSALGALGTTAAVALAALVVSYALPQLRCRTFGLSERIFIVAVTVAPLLAAIAVATGPVSTSS